MRKLLITIGAAFAVLGTQRRPGGHGVGRARPVIYNYAAGWSTS